MQLSHHFGVQKNLHNKPCIAYKLVCNKITLYEAAVMAWSKEAVNKTGLIYIFLITLNLTTIIIKKLIIHYLIKKRTIVSGNSRKVIVISNLVAITLTVKIDIRTR